MQQAKEVFLEPTLDWVLYNWILRACFCKVFFIDIEITSLIGFSFVVQLFCTLVAATSPSSKKYRTISKSWVIFACKYSTFELTVWIVFVHEWTTCDYNIVVTLPAEIPSCFSVISSSCKIVSLWYIGEF